MDLLKFGESFTGDCMPIPSQACLKENKEGVETERAASKKCILQGEETVQTTNSLQQQRLAMKIEVV
ncbi:hypothetical protein [Bartonella sp. WD16.2]|uniref:hypothetical protein n=1 Tax=Bartonella sp. WD16.2 TaxID=1933904 RepID=UPI0009993248|nr:hypothetical protein [Bartonella sp. WD16.2]